MKGNLITTHWNTILSTILRLMLAFFAIAVLAGVKFPFVSGEKASFITLAVIGVAVSVAGNWNIATVLRFTPINVIGSILGVAALLLIIFTLIGTNIPFITGYRTAFLLLAVLLFLKIGLKILQNAISK